MPNLQTFTAEKKALKEELRIAEKNYKNAKPNLKDFWDKKKLKILKEIHGKDNLGQLLETAIFSEKRIKKENEKTIVDMFRQGFKAKFLAMKFKMEVEEVLEILQAEADKIK